MLQLYKNIKNRRIDLKMTQGELADLTGYAGKSIIARIEHGQIDLPQSKIVAFAAALHTTPAALMGWESSDKDIDLKSDEKTLLSGYRQLDDMDKGIVQGEVRQLLRDDKYQREKAVNE